MPWNLPTQLMNLTLLTGVGSAGLAAATYVWRRSLPVPAQLALAHTAAAGFAVSAASTQRLAAQSTGLFGKVGNPLACLAGGGWRAALSWHLGGDGPGGAAPNRERAWRLLPRWLTAWARATCSAARSGRTGASPGGAGYSSGPSTPRWRQ